MIAGLSNARNRIGIPHPPLRTINSHLIVGAPTLLLLSRHTLVLSKQSLMLKLCDCFIYIDVLPACMIMTHVQAVPIQTRRGHHIP